MSARGAEGTPGWWTARALGICCGPTLMPLAMLAIAAGRSGAPPAEWAALFLIFTSLLPIGLVLTGYAAGLVRDLGVSRHEDRPWLVWLGAGSAVLGTLTLAQLGADWQLVALAAAVASQAVVLAGLTAYEKVSYHSGGAAGLAAAAWLLLGGTVGVAAALLALATGWSRWRLGKHTPRQVALGYATSVAALPWLFTLG